MEPWRDETASDFARWFRWGFAFRKPISQTLVLGLEERSPHDALEELREADPDGHALLTEHIVLPPAPQEKDSRDG